ncbi:unnamed protein product [Mytilus coruscus]|uniref:VLIG-type G domain-containing protein n=1 Tax=Mytilus coruscus TaxID=42192 RepID=A0A6J8BJB6_MYTCO|nr:unnamed protein product [Mytilus coruscus]
MNCNFLDSRDQSFNTKTNASKMKGKKCSFTEAFTSVKHMLGEFSEIVTLPTDEESKQRVINRMEDEFTKCVDFLGRKEFSPAEVIENSTAVHSIFCTKNLDDWIEPRRQVVKIKRNVQFRTPTLTQRDNIVEHDSQSITDVFDDAVQKSGWGFAASLKASYCKVGGSIEYEGESQEDSISQHQSSLCTSYFCKTTCSVVPVALWTPSLADVSLCEDIVQDLKQIEDIISIQGDLAEENVHRIFQKYGSHFYCGNVHFGGLFQVKTEFQTEKESDKSSIEEIVSTTHSASVHACMNVFGTVQIEGNVSGHTQYSIGQIEENKQSNQHSKIHTSLTKLGGPIEINSIGLWKKGLIQNNNSWAVVDGGKPIITENQPDHKSFVGLWDLVHNESPLFKDSIVLSTVLLETWNGVSGLKVPKETVIMKRIQWYQSKLNLFIAQIAVTELTSESCFESFNTLSSIVHECGTAIGYHSVWKYELTKNGKLHSLLERLLFIQFKDLDAIETSHKVRKLLTIGSDVNFPHKAAILNWLKEIKKPSTAKLFREDKIDSIDNIFGQFRTVASNDKMIQFRTVASNDKMPVSFLTGEVATAITKVLIKFRTEKTVLEYMVFVSFVLLLDFDIKEENFRVQLTSDKIYLCIDETEKIQAKLMKFKKMQHQIGDLKRRKFKRTKQWKNSNQETISGETKEDIVDHFSSSLEPTIKTVITQNDVDEVCGTLKEIADGQGPVSGSHLSWTHFEHISSDNFCSMDVLQGTDITNRKTADTGYTADKDVDRDMADTLHTFGLEKYFPEKISVQMALSIHDDASTNTNGTNIPWVILKKVISANSDFRVKILKDFWNNSVKSQSSRGDLLDNLYSDDEDDTIESETYHPSDVFLAIFQCCDPFLKRLIVTKLSFCQFAVPIIFRNYANKDLVFSTWPISDIILHGKTEALIRKNTHSVSFIRFGKGSVPSKSKFINEFLREINEEHATFIHKDCPLGMKNRTVSRGMVEMSWFVPDENGTKSGPNIGAPFNIFNLRGDAQEFEKQLAILLLLSNLMVISISCDDLQHELGRILQQVYSSNVSVIILTDMTASKEDKQILKKYIKDMKIDISKTWFISTLEKSKDKRIKATKLSSSDLKVILATKIVDLLQNIGKGIQIEEVKTKLPDGIRSDESPKCVIGRRLAEELLKQCTPDEKNRHRKDTFLPLQEDLKCNLNDKTGNVLNQLPHVVAKLLFLGHPFEIMDGDASNIPQKWVTAVLTEVQNIVGLEKKIVTMSVLGIQSSDTEGLRTPERAGDKVHHDNEIATLVVGLSDVVLLNLNGETIADMANILEIVITGLLRITQVNKNLTLRQSCIFIHQNVSNDAKMQMLQGNRNIIKYLDDMTKDVAIQENIANINHFADVINFNPIEDIKYVPELLHGSPGMGPVNQKYSVEVTNIQKCILREKVSVISPLTFENYLLHLQSLWQGIQAEDFIFSFRSILEIKSYGILESEYQRLIWELEELKLDWMNNNIKPRLQPCQDVRSINECALILDKEWQEETKYEESSNSLQDFVTTSELQEHMEHYKGNKLISLKFKISQLEQDTRQSIKQEKVKCTSKLSTEDILTLKEKQITSTARDLARVLVHAQARNGISEIFIDIDQEFYNLLRQETEYNQSQFSGIMKKVITKFKSLNSANQCFKLTPKLEISVALRVARYSFYQFQNMNKNYEDKYGLKARFEAKKTKVYQMFINTCEKQAEEIIVTNILCDELKISIEEKLQRELQLKMYREIVQKFNHQKHHLMKHIMENLAINEQLNEFITYIRNPETYVQKCLKMITDRVFSRKILQNVHLIPAG